MPRILLIDDDADLGPFLCDGLRECGHSIEWLTRAEEGFDLLARILFDLVLLDNKMPGMTGMEFLEALRDRGIESPIILMTGYADSDTAIRAINLGAFEYVIKSPVDFWSTLQELQPVIKRALSIRPKEIRVPGQSMTTGAKAPKLVGNSKAMRDVSAPT